jgi:precorrin-3B synthase
VLVCDLDDSVADAGAAGAAPAMGLVFDDTRRGSTSALHRQPRLRVTPPPMSRADAAHAVTDPSAEHRHFVGCERACGSNSTPAG